jgi:hypothetical protein
MEKSELTKGSLAIVVSDIAPLYVKDAAGELADEALYGMIVTIDADEEDGLVPVTTHYRYSGFAPNECLLPISDEEAEKWRETANHIVTAPYTSVMSYPSVQAGKLTGVPRGAIISADCELEIGKSVYKTGSKEEYIVDEKGWVTVTLADGRTGYMRVAHIAEKSLDWHDIPEDTFRKRVVVSALCYLGASYRWGGKTPLGIDCSGLASMAYMLNGCLIYRDAHIKEGFPIKEITRDQMKPGDLIFFKGHVALHIGSERFVHATSYPGSDGVVLNSLNPADPDYREDLDKGVIAVGTVYPSPYCQISP